MMSDNSKSVLQVDVGKLDFHHYLPIFFDAISETQKPKASIPVDTGYALMCFCNHHRKWFAA